MCMPVAHGGEQAASDPLGLQWSCYVGWTQVLGKNSWSFSCRGITSGSHKNSVLKKAIRTKANLKGQALIRTEKEKAVVHGVLGYRVHNLRFKGREDSTAPVA